MRIERKVAACGGARYRVVALRKRPDFGGRLSLGRSEGKVERSGIRTIGRFVLLVKTKRAGGASIPSRIEGGYTFCEVYFAPLPVRTCQNSWSNHLTREFPTRDQPLVVLRDVSLKAQGGESLAIVGPSGSGKSTLLGILGTLLPPTSGRVTLDGQDPFVLPEPRLAAFRNRRIGFVFQDHYLLPQCTLLENVLVPAVAAGAVAPRPCGGPKCCWIASDWPNDGTIGRQSFPGASGSGPPWPGPSSKAPELLLADEPTGNLDRAAAEGVGRLLLELQQQEPMILIVVTHSQLLAAMMGRQLELSEATLRERG